MLGFLLIFISINTVGGLINNEGLLKFIRDLMRIPVIGALLLLTKYKPRLNVYMGFIIFLCVFFVRNFFPYETIEQALGFYTLKLGY